MAQHKEHAALLLPLTQALLSHAAAGGSPSTRTRGAEACSSLAWTAYPFPIT